MLAHWRRSKQRNSVFNPNEAVAMNVVIYTRDGCHLCEDAHALLRANGCEPRLVDVDADEALRERFNECVPVVEIDGKIRFRGRVDPLLLKRLLRATAAQPDSQS